ncbi:MAG: glycoside hydrolase family 2 [Bacteroidaceae bacterium]|nr:glycoside hydrolase family 2 [Bacteroidaceae bacterium]
MKKSLLFTMAALLTAGAILSGLLTACTSKPETDKLYTKFQTLPDSQRMAVYWYWISDNISVEGVQHDLEAMKKAGITRAFIGNIWEGSVKPGPVKVMSPEWWEVLHAALKKATELDMEIGMFNCPGWSQSGGPWIQPQQSMRYLAQESLTLQGNGEVQHFTLPSLGDGAQDVRVIAMPAAPHKAYTFDVAKEAGVKATRELHLPEPITLRSILFQTEGYLLVDAIVEAMVGGEYQTLRVEHLDRTNMNRNVGFHPLAPIALTVPDTPVQDIRLTLNGGGQPTQLSVTFSEQPRVERYEEKSLGKMYQSPLPMWDEYMWPTMPEPLQAGIIVQPSQVQDITELMKPDGTVEWQVPDGEWTVYRTGMLTTGVTNGPAAPEATGLEVDKMSREHVAAHFDAYMGEILRRIPEEDRKSLVAVVEDSYETGGQNWTDDMIPAFQSTYGYDPTPWIPVLYGQVVGSQDQSERFLWDLRRLIADRVAYDYVGGLRDVSNQSGLTTWLECYGHWGFPSEFLMYGGQSDEVAGEFWSEGSLGDIENRAASSCAHIYGKQKVWAESCTAGGPVFNRYPALMKQRTDRFFCEGINATLLHLYIQQPDETTYPGISAWFGNEFNRKNTWFSQMDLFTDYLRRCNLMLQQGQYIADVAYYIGEDAPKMTGDTKPALPRGYSFDYINAEILEQSTVEDGLLTLPSGMQYHVLVLPQQKTMRPEVLDCIAELTRNGLTVLGPQPTASPSMQDYPECDERVRELASEMWAGPTYGQGRVYPDGTELQTILDELGVVPDCIAEEGVSYAYIHRRLRGADVYFVSNQSGEPQTFDALFRINGKAPDTWDPVTGERRQLQQFSKADKGQTLVPLHLEPFQSLFVVFDSRRKPEADAPANYPEPQVLATAQGPWTVTFQAERRGPAEPVVFDELADWSQSPDEAIKYYSGSATYEGELNLDAVPDEPLYLDLGRVMVMARVWVNDQYAGGVWTAPYRVPVSGLLQQGKNAVRIEVVNNWRNRLIGDARLPEAERQTYATVNPYNAESALQESGLMGPVRLVAIGN